MVDLSNRTHGLVGTYSVGCRCEPCTLAHRLRMREYVAKRTAEDGISPTQRYRPRRMPTTCSGCSRPIRQAFSNTPLCRTCKNIPKSRSQRVAKAERALARAARGTRSKMTWTCGVCTECAEAFVVRASVPVALCSRKCRTAAKYRARSSAFRVSRRVRMGIYERDGWVCQLCASPVDPDLHYLDDWSATLDHIVCQSWVLIPDHSPANLRLAHRWCNSVRGDEVYESGLFATTRR